MKCPNCSSELKEVEVSIHGAKNKVISYQCPNDDFFEFEPGSSTKAIEELRETPFKIKQKVVKLSADRLGIYFNKDLVRSLGLKQGGEAFISVPAKNRIIIDFNN